MIVLLMLLQLCLAVAAVALFFYVSSTARKEFIDWLILILVFFAITKLAAIFMFMGGGPGAPDVLATLDMGFATAFTTFVFMRCREVEII